MKETQSFRLAEELVSRLEILAGASRLKKGTLIEMCIEKYLPILEKRYEKELEEHAKKALAHAESLIKKEARNLTYPPHQPQHSFTEDKASSAQTMDTAGKGSGDTEKLDNKIAGDAVISYSSKRKRTKRR